MVYTSVFVDVNSLKTDSQTARNVANNKVLESEPPVAILAIKQCVLDEFNCWANFHTGHRGHMVVIKVGRQNQCHH